jgi:putative salt-induced outer membrane protein
VNKKVARFVLGAVLGGAAVQAQADWTGKGEVGYVMARGNSDTSTGNAKVDMLKETEHTKQNFGASFLYGESGEVQTAQRWDGRWQTDWKITEKAFWFGGARYEDDRFSGFDYQTTASTGAGYAFYDTPTTQLRVQLGAGYRRLRVEQLIKDTNDIVIQRILGPTTADAVANGQVKYEHSFNESTKVLNLFLVESGQNNTLAQNELSLQVKMNETLALALGYSIRNNSHPPVALAKTDTLTTVNLVYEMK